MRTFRTRAMDADEIYCWECGAVEPQDCQCEAEVDEDERQALMESVVERWAREGYTADGYAMDEAESTIHEDARNDWDES